MCRAATDTKTYGDSAIFYTSANRTQARPRCTVIYPLHKTARVDDTIPQVAFSVVRTKERQDSFLRISVVVKLQ